MEIRLTALCFVLALSALNGCSGKPATNAPAVNQTPAVAPAAQPGAQTVTGTVAETIDASPYTYLRVKTDSGELWAAASQFKVEVGDRVVVSLETPMQNFHSQTLNRDFPLIYFVPRIAREGEPTPPAMAVGHSPAESRPASAGAAVATEIVAPAKGGTTVANVWANRAALAGKQATVRGKIVKFTGGVLGLNWVHVQDGTGAAADGSNDLTLTTTTEAKVGDVITATGTVAVDKDLGSGYRYAVILENAVISVK